MTTFILHTVLGSAFERKKMCSFENNYLLTSTADNSQENQVDATASV